MKTALLMLAAVGVAAQTPLPLVPGAKVVPLWPTGSPTLKDMDTFRTFATRLAL